MWSPPHRPRPWSMVRRNSTGHVVFMAMGIMAVFTVFVDLVCLHQMEAGTAVTVTTNDPIQLGQQTPRISAIMTSSLSRPADGSKDKDKDDKQYGRAGVVRRLQDAGVTSLTYSIIHQLPTWKQITELYGEHPVIVNEDSCTLYQSRVPPKRRMLGSAGMFSTGTNLVTTLLKKNCKIPERVQWYGMNASRELHGIRWQVPWGKHTQQQYRDKHATEQAKAIVKDDLLPVVTIRHPIQWMQSMCRNPYTAQWSHKRNQCPNLRHYSQEEQNDDEAKAWNPVTVKYGAGTEHYHSLAHLYNDWYHGYTEHAKYPWIMIRMEGTLAGFLSIMSVVGFFMSSHLLSLFLAMSLALMVANVLIILLLMFFLFLSLSEKKTRRFDLSYPRNHSTSV